MAVPTGLHNMRVEEPESGLWIASFNRPEVFNALNTDTVRDMKAIFAPLAFHPGDLRCVVLTAAGDKAFSAGGDLKERKGMSDEAWREQHALIEEGAYALMNSAVPVIAAVNGLAFGGGCELALCCDFIYAVKTAKFALPEVTRGIMPGAGGTQNLPRVAGSPRAKEVMFTGTPFSAQEAYDWGMVNKLCEPDKLMEDVLATARTIARNAPISVQMIKKAIKNGMQTDMTTALMIEIAAYNRTVTTEDRLEGVLAFNEKRPPNFKGR
jgi:enoyl-CoA hydratase/carnithine racemase